MGGLSGLIAGSANLTWTSSGGHGDFSFNGIALGAFLTITLYHVMNLIQKYGPLKGALTPVTATEAGAIEGTSKQFPPTEVVPDIVVPDHVPEHFKQHNPYRPGTKT